MLFQVAVLVAEVCALLTTTEMPHSVWPGTGAPGSRLQPFGVLGAVKAPVVQVYVLVPLGKVVGALAAHW